MIEFIRKLKNSITQFLQKNQVDETAIELVLFAGEIPTLVENQINYEVYTGLYYSSVAFACHLANDYKLSEGKLVLIINHQINGKLGLILMR